jgi:hypothetical protein
VDACVPAARAPPNWRRAHAERSGPQRQVVMSISIDVFAATHAPASRGGPSACPVRCPTDRPRVFSASEACRVDRCLIRQSQGHSEGRNHRW